MQIGLTEQQAQQRLAGQGENRLAAAKRKRPLSIFLGQFRDVKITDCTTWSLMGEYCGQA